MNSVLKNEEQLKKNLDMLFKVNPTLTEMIEHATEPTEILDYWDDENKFLNMTYRKNNQELLVYRKTKPWEEVKEFIKNQLRLFQDTVSIIIGMGFGHLAYEACKTRDKKHIILIVEIEPWFIKKAFMLYDFSKEIETGNILFACPGKSEMSELIVALESRVVINNWKVVTDAIAVKWSEKYAPIMIETCDFINQMQCNVGTVMGAGPIIAQNDISSFPYVIRHRGIKELKDLFKNVPAILVNTGPSLQKNIHLLMNKKVRDRCIIIAIAQSLRILLAYDIIPDFITTVDYGEVNKEHFDRLWDCNVPLVCINKTYAEILKRWKGQKFIVGSPEGYENTVSQMIMEKGFVDQGGSVSHMNFGTAVLLGCNPITLIGMDCGYEGELSHNPNADASGKIATDEKGNLVWNVDAPNSILKGKPSYMGQFIPIEGYFGRPIKTNAGLLSFMTSFERLFEHYSTSKDIYNSTEGGAHIKGSKRITLNNFIKQFCTKKVDKEKLKPFLSLADKWEDQIEIGIKVINSELGMFTDLVKHCEKAIEWNKKMIHHFKNKKKLFRDLEENQKESTEAEQLAKKNPTIATAIYYASRMIHDKELNVDGKSENILENKKDLQIRVDRNRIILEASIKACKDLTPLYEEAKKALEVYWDTRDEKIFTGHQKDEKPFDFTSAHEWFDKGNFAYPYIEAKKLIFYKELPEYDLIVRTYLKSLKMREESIAKAYDADDRQPDIDYVECVFKARELGKIKQFDEALKYLYKAYKMKTKRSKEEVLWGLATTYYIKKKIGKALRMFKKLTEQFPESLQYKFEYGTALLQRDIIGGFKIIEEVMSKSNVFDYFYKSIGDFWLERETYDKAVKAYTEYVKRYPEDISVEKKMEKCFKAMKGE